MMMTTTMTTTKRACEGLAGSEVKVGMAKQGEEGKQAGVEEGEGQSDGDGDGDGDGATAMARRWRGEGRVGRGRKGRVPLQSVNRSKKGSVLAQLETVHSYEKREEK